MTLGYLEQLTAKDESEMVECTRGRLRDVGYRAN